MLIYVIRLIYACTINVVYCFLHTSSRAFGLVVKQNVVRIYFCNILNFISVYITLCSLMELLSNFVSDFKLLCDKNENAIFFYLCLFLCDDDPEMRKLCVFFRFIFLILFIHFFRGKSAIKKPSALKINAYTYIAHIYINNKSVLSLTDLFHIHVCHAHWP